MTRHATAGRQGGVERAHQAGKRDGDRLAHALMSEVALDCGYPTSALKVRVYVLPRARGEPSNCGVLLSTATAGTKGTLGGLVAVTSRFARVLSAALERVRVCSGDAVSADHDPAGPDEIVLGIPLATAVRWSPRQAASPATLDRGLLADTVGPTGGGYFVCSKSGNQFESQTVCLLSAALIRPASVSLGRISRVGPVFTLEARRQFVL